jgi:hypothetical protein
MFSCGPGVMASCCCTSQGWFLCWPLWLYQPIALGSAKSSVNTMVFSLIGVHDFIVVVVRGSLQKSFSLMFILLSTMDNTNLLCSVVVAAESLLHQRSDWWRMPLWWLQIENWIIQNVWHKRLYLWLLQLVYFHLTFELMLLSDCPSCQSWVTAGGGYYHC